MVNPQLRFYGLGLLALIACQGILSGTPAIEEIPNYRLGEEAREDITTPLPLSVVNGEETAALKQKEALRVPVICRYQTNIAAETEVRLINAFFNVKSNFLAQMETSLVTNKIDLEEVSVPRFQKFYNIFRRANKGFPVTTNLAGLWATGEDDEAFLGNLSGILRDAMRHGVRSGTLPPELKLTWSVRMVYVTNFDQEPTLEMAEKQGPYFRNTNVLTVAKTREGVVNRFSAAEKALGKFVASFVVTNCAPDLKLTLLARSNRVQNIWPFLTIPWPSAY